MVGRAPGGCFDEQGRLIAVPKRTTAIIESWPQEVRLYVPALPGFQVNAPSQADALAIARDAVGGFIAWLDAYELHPGIDPAAPFDVIETLAAEGAAGPLFDADRQTAARAPFELALAVARVMIGDLIDRYEAAGAVEDRLQVESALRRIAQQERWYAGRLGFVSQTPPSRDPVDDLVAAAGDVEDAADAAFSSGRGRIVTTDGEQWTLTKLLRRRTGHLGEQLSRLNRR